MSYSYGCAAALIRDTTPTRVQLIKCGRTLPVAQETKTVHAWLYWCLDVGIHT